jgi:hypothetical protein
LRILLAEIENSPKGKKNAWGDGRSHQTRPLYQYDHLHMGRLKLTCAKRSVFISIQVMEIDAGY